MENAVSSTLAPSPPPPPPPLPSTLGKRSSQIMREVIITLNLYIGNNKIKIKRGKHIYDCPLLDI